jgi:hypothetical protein
VSVGAGFLVLRQYPLSFPPAVSPTGSQSQLKKKWNELPKLEERVNWTIVYCLDLRSDPRSSAVTRRTEPYRVRSRDLAALLPSLEKYPPSAFVEIRAS